MRKLSAFILALVLATVVAVGALVAGEKKKYPGLWSKYDSLPAGSECFITVSHPASVFCPYGSELFAVATTIGTGDLPPVTKRIYLRPTQLKLSQNQ